MIKNTLIVAAGGSIGCGFRYLISLYIQKHFSGMFPLPTFIVNITGCILIGLLVGLAEKFQLISPEIKLFLITGFCGGYTTFSTFSLENIQLLYSHNPITLFFYIIGSISFGILGVWLGILISKIN